MFRNIILIFLILLSNLAYSNIYNYNLNRVILDDLLVNKKEESGPEVDSLPNITFLELDERNNIVGNLTVILNDDQSIKKLTFDMELCLPKEFYSNINFKKECYYIFDSVNILEYTGDGRIYKVQSNINGRIYNLHIIRRGITVDPTFIFKTNLNIENRYINIILLYRFNER